MGVLRAGVRKWEQFWDAKKEASVGRMVNQKTGRQAEHFRCAGCDGLFTSREIQVDHIDPVVEPAVGFVDWDTAIDRMFCEADNLQVLCTECHREKTNRERKERKRR
jgi:5-methylcytosine-specific restriction endonuclease McrA